MSQRKRRARPRPPAQPEAAPRAVAAPARAVAGVATPRVERAALAAPWLLTAAAAAVRLYRLDREPLWFDEAYTALSVVLPIGTILTRLRGEGNAPLYYLLMHVWTSLFGDGEYALRLVSALAGAAAVPLLYWIGRRMFSRRAGLIAAALAVISPLQVHYSQEARMYPLVPPLALLVLYGLYRLLTAPTRPAFVGFVAAAVAGLYVHYFFLFLLPLAACALAVPQRRRAVLLVAAAALLIGVGFAPWLPTFLAQSANASPDWIAGFWQQHAIIYAPLWSIESLGPGARYPFWSTFKFASSTAAGVVSLGLAALVIGGALFAIGRDRRAEDAGDGGALWAIVLTLGATLLPLIIALVVSLLRRPVYAVARYDLIAWGAYYLLAGAVLARLKPAVAWPAMVLWLGLSLFTLWPYFTTDRPKRNYADLGKSFAQTLLERARPGESVIFTASTRTMTQYYLRQAPDRLRLMSFPLDTDTHLGWIDERIKTDGAFADAAARGLAATLIDAGSAPAVVWVVAPDSRGTAPLLTQLEQRGYHRDTARSTRLLLCLRRN
ncbi:MAG: glycosyltransferase family 39 protein [Candidatus Binatia bacterium]